MPGKSTGLCETAIVVQATHDDEEAETSDDEDDSDLSVLCNNMDTNEENGDTSEKGRAVTDLQERAHKHAKLIRLLEVLPHARSIGDFLQPYQSSLDT